MYNLEAPPGVVAEFGFIVSRQPRVPRRSVRSGWGLWDHGRRSRTSARARDARLDRQDWASPPNQATTGSAGESRAKHATEEEASFGRGPLGIAHTVEKAGLPRTIDMEAPGASAGGAAVDEPDLVRYLPHRVRSTSTTGENPGEPSSLRNRGPTPAKRIQKEIVTLPPLTGCEKLDFSPSIRVQPDGGGQHPDGFERRYPRQPGIHDQPHGLGEADVKDTTVDAPAGVTRARQPPTASKRVRATSPTSRVEGQPAPRAIRSASRATKNSTRYRNPGVKTPGCSPRGCPAASPPARPAKTNS